MSPSSRGFWESRCHVLYRKSLHYCFKNFYSMGDILTKIQTRFKCSFVPPSFLQVNMLLFVIAENCEIVKLSVFIIYLPKSRGCYIHFDVAIGSHIYLQVASSLLEACAVCGDSPSLCQLLLTVTRTWGRSIFLDPFSPLGEAHLPRLRK